MKIILIFYFPFYSVECYEEVYKIDVNSFIGINQRVRIPYHHLLLPPPRPSSSLPCQRGRQHQRRRQVRLQQQQGRQHHLYKQAIKLIWKHEKCLVFTILTVTTKFKNCIDIKPTFYTGKKRNQITFRILKTCQIRLISLCTKSF